MTGAVAGGEKSEAEDIGVIVSGAKNQTTAFRCNRGALRADRKFI